MPSGRIVRLTLAALALAVAVAPVWWWDGGLIEKESTHFVRQYLDERPLARKVFDPHANDIGTYQARELSYVIDYVDARVLAALLGRDVVWLVPFSALLAAGLTVVAFTAFAGRVFPRIPPVTATLALLLYLTNHVFSVTTAVYYRSSKPLLPPLIITAAMYLMSTLQASPGRERRRPRALTSRFVVTLTLGSTMSLLDRQGFFYAVLMAAAVALWHRARGHALDCVLGSAAAVVLMVLYNFLVGPWLVWALNGYSPSFDYQRVDVQHLIRHPLHVVQAIRLLAQSTQVVLGSFPPWLYAAAAAIGFYWRRRYLSRTPRGAWRQRLREPVSRVVLLVAASQVLMFALMIVRHAPIWDWADHRLWYYPLPFQAFVLVGLLLFIDVMLRRWPAIPRIAVNAAIVAMMAGNLAGWASYRRVMLAAPWFPGVYEQSTLLKRSLHDGSPLAGLDAEYRTFYDFWTARRADLGRPGG